MAKIIIALIAVTLIFGAAAQESATNSEKDAGVTEIDPKCLQNPRQLFFQGRRSGEGYFSNDGNNLIFQSEREPNNPFFQIYILDFVTGGTHRVSPGTGKTTCSFFKPETDEVLFASTHLDPDAEAKQKNQFELREAGKEKSYGWEYDEYFDIFASRRDGTGLRRLTETYGYDAEGAYSPDGSKIVFCSIRNGYPVDKLSDEDRERMENDPSYFAEIYIMDEDGGNQVRLTDWPGYDGGPFFTPDGRRIVWRHFDETGMLADIYTMRIDGTDRRRLTDFESMSWAPYFHPSGEYVIFASNKLGFSNFELFMVDALGTKEPVRVTFADGFDSLPVFSPNGKQLAWTSNRTANKKGQIFIAGWDHDAAVAALREAPVRSGAQEQPLTPEISAADLQTQVGYLASDRLEGRMTGSRGTQLASEYIAGYLEDNGLQPLGGDDSYYQTFPFTSGMNVVDDECRFQVTTSAGDSKPITGTVHEDFRPLAFSSSGTAEGDVVFAGYGLKVPGEGGEGYDSYTGLEVKDKIVLVLNYVPEDVEMERRQELNLYSGLRYKAMVARENGARAILVVTGPNSHDAGELVSIKFDRSSQSSGIVAASISGSIAEQMFAAAGKDLKEVQTGLDDENPHFGGTFDLPGVAVSVATAVERERSEDRNVIALIPPADDVKMVEYVIIGAHYDHIGHGEIGSLADKNGEGQIHNGADDNASGTALVMELAATFAEERASNPTAFRRGIIVALWSGEEMGLIGSSYFAENPPVPLENVVAYLNFDMVGRMKENKLTIQGVGSSNAWSGAIEKRNISAGFNLTLQSDPYLPTDASAFYPKGIPVLSFFTGVHDDYNKPSDDPETLEYDEMVRIAKFARSIIADLVIDPERPDYVKVEKSRQRTGMRGAVKAYLGTVPDFASEDVEGVKLSGVRAGGPADKGGVQGGDIIVEFAGQKITNIYDYTFALGGVKIGEPVTMVVLRDGERVTLTVVPEAKE
ncbi:MAG: M28 family peptidase [Candidatus Latescibacterota bacterium]|nr:MAG: M28 family peptidase [Candidatus Latescibacterota bacterium]